MDGSQENAPGSAWAQWPILRRVQRWFADMEPADSHWDAATLQAADGACAGELCVLVVDDNPVNLMLASEMLSCWGIKPMLASDGAEAVALAGELRLDLILMDLQMPVLDGLGAARQIKHHERTLARTPVPVVAYTSTRPAAAVLRSVGIDAVLDKPCDAQAMRACLLQWCPARGDTWAPARPRHGAVASPSW
jgi:CheY-like chemotaxis protein